jgi:hypothetical protein
MRQNNPTKIRKIDRLVNFLEVLENSPKVTPNEAYFSEDYVPKLNREFKTNGITVYFEAGMDGGGTTFGLQVVPVLKNLYPGRVFNRCYEWCSGPGFIGFDILGHGLCKQLWLGDIFRPALRAIDKTIEHLAPQYANCVFPIHVKDGSEIPDSTKFDLIVSNPPHWNSNLDTLYSKMPSTTDRTNLDDDWLVHQNFFKNIKKNLADDGVILLQEQTYASCPDTFRKWVNSAGLSIVGCWWNAVWGDYYYLEIKHQGVLNG